MSRVKRGGVTLNSTRLERAHVNNTSARPSGVKPGSFPGLSRASTLDHSEAKAIARGRCAARVARAVLTIGLLVVTRPSEKARNSSGASDDRSGSDRTGHTLPITYRSLTASCLGVEVTGTAA